MPRQNELLTFHRLKGLHGRVIRYDGSYIGEICCSKRITKGGGRFKTLLFPAKPLMGTDHPSGGVMQPIKYRSYASLGHNRSVKCGFRTIKSAENSVKKLLSRNSWMLVVAVRYIADTNAGVMGSEQAYHDDLIFRRKVARNEDPRLMYLADPDAIRAAEMLHEKIAAADMRDIYSGYAEYPHDFGSPITPYMNIIRDDIERHITRMNDESVKDFLAGLEKNRKKQEKHDKEILAGIEEVLSKWLRPLVEITDTLDDIKESLEDIKTISAQTSDNTRAWYK